MKKLTILTLVLVLSLSLAIGQAAFAQLPTWPPEFAPEHSKITGGSEGVLKYIYQEEGNQPVKEPHRISFGFTAISTDLPRIQERDYGDVILWPAKGQFHLVDHTTKEKVSGDIRAIVREQPTPPRPRLLAEGKCTFKGTEYHLAIEVFDAGEPGVNDFVRIELILPGEPGEPANIVHTWVEELDGGNIQIKYKGPKVPLNGNL